MEVLIQRIDPWVIDEDLYKEVASALHSPPVRLPGQGLTNFRLLFPRTNRGKDKGYAFLTIGETSTASAFLEFCSNERSRRPLDIVRDGKANTLKLTPNAFGNEKIVRRLLSFPYEDWDSRQRRLRGEPANSDSSSGQSDDDGNVGANAISPVPPGVNHRSHQMRTETVRQQARKRIEHVRYDGAWSIIQFGVICEDGSFSIEDYDAPQVPLPSGFDVKANLTAPDFFEAEGQFCADLDIRVAYQFDKLIRNGLYSPTVLEILKDNTRRLIKCHSVDFAARVLESLAVTSRQIQVRDRHTQCLLGSGKLQQRIEVVQQRLIRQDAMEADPLNDQVFTTATAQVYHVAITPTRMLLEGPFMDASNRVLRLFPEFGSHFVRVAFCDEDGDRFPVSRHDLYGIDSESFVRERIGDPLKHGIAIAGRKFEALAWSGSGLGSHHCWFVTAFTDKDGNLWNAERIRQSLGDFQGVDRYPARLGARLSQAFSATSSTIKINDDCVKIVTDDHSNCAMPSNGPNERVKQFYLLTDGVGEISRELRDDIWRELCSAKNMLREWQLLQQDAGRIPSAIQFRYGGAKGVLCLNPQLRGKVVKVRHSMIKFSAPKHRDLEVATTSFHPLPARLNRPLINALEDLGVSADVFLSLQNKAVKSAQLARKDFKHASQLMRSFALSDTAEVHKLFHRLDSILGITPDNLHHDSILNRLCTIVIAAALGDLKRKARIPIDGCTLIGVVDEFNYLGKNEIFVQVNDKEDGQYRIIEGRVMIGRSPTIHPGDVRIVTAVKPPPTHPLRQLRNVVVFNKHPHGRPLQSMLSGADFDGDIFTIYEDEQLFPKQMASPGVYKNTPPRALARPCTFEDLADLFVEFVINDQIGLVSTFHLHIADQSELHSLDPDCVKLAQLHAKAVDYRKTGQAVHRKDVPMPPLNSPRPDFLAQRPVGQGIYASSRALAKLFRAIPEHTTDTPFGAQPSWATETQGKQSALSSILKQPGKADDIVDILTMLTQKFPQIMPEGLRLKQMQAHYRPLLSSFVSHLSRLAAWIPESRTETEWLSEEEILVGTQVMTTKAKQLKRRQERLTASTAELFPTLRAQLLLIASDDTVETSTIRPTPDTDAGGRNKGKSKSTGSTTIPGRERAETLHFTGYAQLVKEPVRKPQARIVVVDGERVLLKEKPGASGTHSPQSDDEGDFDPKGHLDHQATKYALNEHIAKTNKACSSRQNNKIQQTNGKGKDKGKASGTSTPNGSGRGHQQLQQQKGKNKAIACTDPELYNLLYD
ncbi:related to RNA-dependent RNA polymerase [Ustilago bromivora]|uniref:RNA-dependent RNA polymerase n=1 Tax=Ustilago bromivora TaxID=307758 RepID=A0A8H8TQT1_9BASI|nr:related to RNA-dependent RNA polymerase [Ustilago bromivora]